MVVMPVNFFFCCHNCPVVHHFPLGNYKNMTDEVVLVNYDVEKCTVKAAVDEAHKAGEEAICQTTAFTQKSSFSLGVGAVMFLTSGSLRLSYGPSAPAETPPASPLPIVALSQALADTFKGSVSVKADIQATLLTLHTANLIAESKSGSDDTVVVIGSHLDSVPAGKTRLLCSFSCNFAKLAQ